MGTVGFAELTLFAEASTAGRFYGNGGEGRFGGGQMRVSGFLVMLAEPGKGENGRGRTHGVGGGARRSKDGISVAPVGHNIKEYPSKAQHVPYTSSCQHSSPTQCRSCHRVYQHHYHHHQTPAGPDRIPLNPPICPKLILHASVHTAQVVPEYTINSGK
jgi:hypothetical protein